MPEPYSPHEGERSASLTARASGICLIHVFGPNRLLNELLVSFLLAETAHLCRKNRGPRRRSQQECLRIDFIDSREVGFPSRWLQDAEDLLSCSEQRLVVFFNVPEDASEAAECEALVRGVRGIFYRGDSRSTIAKGIRSILAGDVWFQRGTLYRLATVAATRREPVHHPPDWLSLLTGREREILALLATDAGNQEIAGALCVSIHTVKTHLYRIFRKIGVRSRHQAMLWGIAHGAIAVPPPLAAARRALTAAAPPRPASPVVQENHPTAEQWESRSGRSAATDSSRSPSNSYHR